MKPKTPIVEPYKRRRTRGMFYPADRTSQWANSTQNPLPAPVVGSVSGSRGTVEQMDDTVTPAFKNLVINGYIVNNDMSRVKTTRSTSTSGPKFSTVIGGVTYFGDLGGPHWTVNILTEAKRPPNRPVLSIDEQNMIDLAATRAFANIGKPQYQGFVSLGELRETLSYLRNPVASGIKLANTLARLSRKSGLTRGKTRRDGMYSGNDVVKDVAGVYLSVLYGFKPLVADIAAILENLRPRAIPRPQRVTSRAKEERTITDTWSQIEIFSGISYTALYEYTEKVVVSCGYLYVNKEEMCTEEQWGLRPRDVVPAAWAVMSKSFLADWLVNFGDFVSALVPSANTRIINSWTVTTRTRILTRTVSGYSFGTWTTARPGTGTDRVEQVIQDRVHYAPPPTLAVKNLDPLKNDVSRLVSMIAILTGTLKSAGNPPSVTKTARTGTILSQDKWY